LLHIGVIARHHRFPPTCGPLAQVPPAWGVLR
jgi:hypothetical protein